MAFRLLRMLQCVCWSIGEPTTLTRSFQNIKAHILSFGKELICIVLCIVASLSVGVGIATIHPMIGRNANVQPFVAKLYHVTRKLLSVQLSTFLPFEFPLSITCGEEIILIYICPRQPATFYQHFCLIVETIALRLLPP